MQEGKELRTRSHFDEFILTCYGSTFRYLNIHDQTSDVEFHSSEKESVRFKFLISPLGSRECKYSSYVIPIVTRAVEPSSQPVLTIYDPRSLLLPLRRARRFKPIFPSLLGTTRGARKNCSSFPCTGKFRIMYIRSCTSGY